MQTLYVHIYHTHIQHVDMIIIEFVLYWEAETSWQLLTQQKQSEGQKLKEQVDEMTRN